jgi:hypothetical protein
MPEPTVKLALDQNFPALILDAARFLPEFEIMPGHKINPWLSELDDRRLLIALYQLGWRGLITDNQQLQDALGADRDRGTRQDETRNICGRGRWR